MQEVRMALMGHSTGSKVHATYTHIELPVKREAIRKLERWVEDQRQQDALQQIRESKENTDDSTEVERSESGSSPSDRG